MKTFNTILTIILFLIGFSCSKSDTTKDRFFYGKWKLTNVAVGNSPHYKTDQTVIDGDLHLKGYRKKAKRGSYTINIIYENNINNEIVTRNINHEWSFIWWKSVFNAGQESESHSITMNLDDTFEENVLGIGSRSIGAVGVKILDNNTMLVEIEGEDEQQSLYFDLTYKRK